MKADFSRLRAQPDVLEEWLQQQGRVWLDSDWNEATLARLRQLEALVADVVGLRGRPEPGTGFRIGVMAAPTGPASHARVGDFTIGGGRGAAGHVYVDGMLAANRRPTTYFTQPDYPHAPALTLPSATITGWQLVGDLKTARGGHAAALISAPPAPSAVLVCGGTIAGVPTASAERYDPASTSWSARAPMRVARIGHSATELPDGRVLVAGGSGGSAVTFASSELYDPASDTWTLSGPMGSARTLHTATLLPDGRVLVCGGFGQGGGSLPSFTSPVGEDAALTTAEVYSPATGTWSPVAAMSNARADHRAVVVPASSIAGTAGGKVLVTGGQHSGVALAAAELYDPAGNAWLPVPAMASAREAHALVLLADGRVLAAGGTSGGVVLTACEVYAPGTATWRTAADMAHPRANHIGAPIAGDQVLVAGGYAQGIALGSTELYDASLDTWRDGRALNEPRAAHTVSVLDDGSVLVAGGTSAAAQPPATPAPGSTSEIPTAERYHPASTTSAFAYLDVWRRVVTYLQDDQRELALGGPDTTVRARTVAQVKVLQIPDSHQPDSLDCAHLGAYLPDDGAGRLSTLTVDPDPPTNPCAMSDVGVFTGAQNLLYRVEIHDGGQMLGANGPDDLAVQADVAAGSTNVEVGPISAAQVAALTVGRWDLVSGGPSALQYEAADIRQADPSGTITLRVGVRRAALLSAGAVTLRRNDATITLTAPATAGTRTVHVDPESSAHLASSATGALAGRAWYLRSAAGFEPVAVSGIDLTTGVVTLGQALQRPYPTGAEFVVRARYKWSADNASFAVGVTSIVATDPAGGMTTLQLTSLGRDSQTRLHGGDIVELIDDVADLDRGCGLLAHVVAEPDPDSRTVLVDVADPRMLTTDAATILANHLVLRRWDGMGFVGSDPVDLGQGARIQFSGYDFSAPSYWWFTARAQTGAIQELDAAPPNGIQRHRMPLALLRWSGDDETGVTLDRITDCVPIFDPLTGLHASHIEYDDGATALGATTVQDAIEALAPRTYPRISAAGLSWSNDRELSIATFNEGLTVRFTEPLHPATVTTDTFRVRVHVPDESLPLVRVLDLPGTVTHELMPGHAGFRDRLGGLGRGNDPGGLPRGPFVRGVVSATFRPEPPLDALLVAKWRDRLREADPGASVRVDVVLNGDKILDWSGRRALDGDVRGRLGHDAYETFIDLRLPSGDGREGGDFESWLFLAAQSVPVQVADIEPAAGATLTSVPPVIHVMFTKDVAQKSLTPNTVIVRDPAGAIVSGALAPFPFNPDLALVSGITFTPASLATLGKIGTWTVILRGTGPETIQDADGMSLDGSGRGFASDFTSSFQVIEG